jgi:branched-chain amino acid transport system substrate-binding protein
MKKILFIMLAVVLALSVGIIGCAAPAQQEEEEEEEEEEPEILRIGLVYSQTGFLAPGLEAIGQGAVVCAEWINDEGGITIEGQNYIIELVIVDDQSTPEGSVAAANKLVYEENVDFIIDGSIPAFNIAKAQTTEEAGVLRAVLSSGAPEELNSSMPYTFATNRLTLYYAPTYDYLLEAYPEVENIAIVFPDDVGGQYGLDLGTELAEANGLTVVFTDIFPLDTQDFTPLATQIVEANPDAIDMGLCIPVWGAFITQAVRQLGFTGPTFAMSPQDPLTFIALAGEEYAYDVFSACLDPTSTDYPPIAMEVKNRVEDKYGPTYIDQTTGGWTGLWSLVQAIEEAQSLDPTEVAEAWENMESVEALFGTAEMGGLEVMGFNHVVMWPRPLTRMDHGGVVTTVRMVTPRFAELE